jgi:hypothetical protein
MEEHALAIKMQTQNRVREFVPPKDKGKQEGHYFIVEK